MSDATGPEKHGIYLPWPKLPIFAVYGSRTYLQTKCHICRLCVIYDFNEVFTVEIVSMLNVRNELGLITLASTCKIAKNVCRRCWYIPLVGWACETDAHHTLKLIKYKVQSTSCSNLLLFVCLT